MKHIQKQMRRKWFCLLLPMGVGAAALFGGRSLQASTNAVLLATGGQLVKLEEDKSEGIARTVLINGREMIFSSTSTRSAPSNVLDAFAADCVKGTPNKSEPPSRARHALRGGDEQRGFVACTLGGGTFSSTSSFVAAARAFVAGKAPDVDIPVNYVYAERNGARTHVAHLVANFNVQTMFPQTSDAPVDAAARLGVPSPPHARRILSVAERGRAYEVSMFTSATQSPTQTATAHRIALQAEGFVVFNPHAESAIKLRTTESFFVQGPNLFALVVFRANGQGGTTTAIAASRADGVDALSKLMGEQP